MALTVLLCIVTTLGTLVNSKHPHICGKSNHNGSTGELLPHDGKIPPGHECEWHIYPENFNIPEVFMVIEDFRLDKDDKFTVSKHEDALLFGPFNGTKGMFTILTGYLFLDVSVKTENSPSQDRYFKSYFTTNACHYLIEEESGSMTSPLYASVSTRKSITCTWQFRKFKKVTLPRNVFFKTFHLMNSTLTVKGSKSQDGIYKGTKLPPNITAYGETQLILDLNTEVPGETFSFRYDVNGLNIPVPEDNLLDEKKSTPSSLQSSRPCGHINLKGEKGFFEPKNNTMIAKHSCIWTIGPVEKPRGIYIVIDEYDLIGSDTFTVRNSSEGPALFGPYYGNQGRFSVFTDETMVEAVVVTSSSDLMQKRHFRAFYSTSGCTYEIIDNFGVMHSPFYKTKDQQSLSCSWSFLAHPHDAGSVMSVSFERYNIKSSNFQIDGSIGQDKLYKATDGPFDILMKENGKIVLEIDRTAENESFSFSYNTVNPECSNYLKIAKKETTTLLFPPSDSKNQESLNCQWIIEGDGKGVLAVHFDDINLLDAKDFLLVKEGRTRNSPSLVQVTKDNQEDVRGSYIVADASVVWVSFTTQSAFRGSHFKIDVNVSESNRLSKGGNFTIVASESGVDVVFYLEVDKENQVFLNMYPNQNLPSGGTIVVYNGFNSNTILTKIQSGKLFYPVVATGSKMMVVAKGFPKDNAIKLKFDGIKKGCHQVTLDYHGTYSLSGNCDNSCSWVILPKHDNNQEMLSLHVSPVALRPHDVVEVRRLDESLSLIETVRTNENNHPNIFLPASYGAYINVTRSSCLSSDAKAEAFFASVETLSGCSMTISLEAGEKVSLTSPNYPDIYPLHSNCFWNITTKADNLYISFRSFKLASGHCVKVHETDDGHVVDTTYDNSNFSYDKIVSNYIALQLVASPCTEVNGTIPTTGNGFIVDVFAIDCGGTVGKELRGTINTPDFPEPVKGHLLCIWHVEVPAHNKDGSVNVVSFSIKWSPTSEDKQTGLTVHDGPSLSSETFTNDSTSIDLLSKRNSLIFIYEHNDTSDHPGLQVNFESRAGNFLCDNGVYMHSDWICNGLDDCGDYSDEKDCKGRIPPPPPVPPAPPNNNITKMGVSNTIFWSIVPSAFVFGIIATILTAYILKEVKKRRELDYDTIPILS